MSRSTAMTAPPPTPGLVNPRRHAREEDTDAAATIDFVLSHRAVTTALASPRTITHLDSALGATPPPDDVLDAIDAIVPPGTVLNDADAGWAHPALSDAARRRR